MVSPSCIQAVPGHRTFWQSDSSRKDNMNRSLTMWILSSPATQPLFMHNEANFSSPHHVQLFSLGDPYRWVPLILYNSSLTRV